MQAGQEQTELPEGASPRPPSLWLVHLCRAVRPAKVVGGPGAPGPCGLLQRGGDCQRGGKVLGTYPPLQYWTTQDRFREGRWVWGKRGQQACLGPWARPPPAFLPGKKWEPLTPGWQWVQERLHDTGAAAKSMRFHSRSLARRPARQAPPAHQEPAPFPAGNPISGGFKQTQMLVEQERERAWLAESSFCLGPTESGLELCYLSPWSSLPPGRPWDGGKVPAAGWSVPRSHGPP